MSNACLLEIKGCCKSFPGVKALDNVSLNLRRGEVHALVGENGAGKSTIMKILAGIYKMDKGEILYDGKPLTLKCPSDALEKGISMVHQELDLIPEMTVENNIFAGHEKTKGLVLDRKSMTEKTLQLMKELDIEIDPKTKVKYLSTAQQQMIAIMRAIAFNAEIIIMDEPTSAITEREVKKLFKIIEQLKSQQKCIVYISHKMNEIFTLSDRITVLRDGCLIGTIDAEGATSDGLISMMVGRTLSDMYIKNAPFSNDFDRNEVLLRVEGLSRKGEFSDISFELKRGEVLGIYGLMGAGRTETMETIFGLRKADAGKVYVKDTEIRSVKGAINNGVAFITEDRKLLGLNLIASVASNTIITYIKKVMHGGFLRSFRKERETVDSLIQTLRIKCASRDVVVGTLSGGNQQKVVLAKWFLGKPDILIMDEPTRGIDVGAKAEIYKLIDQLAKEGKAVIMISSEMAELFGMSDRIIVMHEGLLKGEFARDEADQDTLLQCAIGERG